MKEQSVYIPVPVRDRLPEKRGKYGVITEADEVQGGSFNPENSGSVNSMYHYCTHWLEKREDVFVLTKEELKDFAEKARRYTINNSKHIAQADNAVYVMGSTDDFFNDWLSTQPK